MTASASIAPRRGLLPRQRAALAIHGVAVVALVPGFLFLAPPSRWDPGLLVVLAALTVLASHSEVRLPNGAIFDGVIVLMLLAVALAGALAAMEVVVLRLATDAITGRRPALRAGNLGELAHSGWQAISAALLLQAGHVDEPTSPAALGWLLTAGFTLYTVGWALGPAIFGPLWLGHPVRTLVRAFVDMLPAGAVLIVFAAATVLTGTLGVAALAVFAVLAILPQSFLSYAARTRPIATLDHSTATRRYAHALALQLGLSRTQRRHVSRVAAAAGRRPPTGRPIDYVRATLRDPTRANADAQLVSELWSGDGGPIGLRGDAIPLAARVVAVAQTWSALTARGTAMISHRDAITSLRAQAEIRLDPAIVDAAQAVISQERVTADQPAPEPRLHRLRVPASLRRALTAS